MVKKLVQSKIVEKERPDGLDYNQYYNKGNDCDCCENQYRCGMDGDGVGCVCFDENRECNFIEYKEQVHLDCG